MPAGSRSTATAGCRTSSPAWSSSGLSNAAGPTNGKIVLRDGVTEPKTVGIIHCVGSRDRNYNNYCSAICCMQSLKFAHLVKEHTGATVYNFYIDMRTPAKAYDEFYQRVLEEGTIFVRGKVAEVTDAAREPGRRGQAHRPGRRTPWPAGSGASRSTWSSSRPAWSRATTPRRWPRLFGISCSSDGWLHREAPQARSGRHDDRGHLHRRLRPGAEGHPGLGGAGRRRRRRASSAASSRARSPSSRSGPASTRSTARAAASATTSAPSTPSASTRTAWVTEINPALCQGCGTCVAACPAGAISGTGFSNEQILAQIEGLLMRQRWGQGAGTGTHAHPRGGARMTSEATVEDTPALDLSRPGASSGHHLRAGHHRLHLQLVQLPGRRPGRHGTRQVPAQHPADPAHVLGPAGPDLRAQGICLRAPTACWSPAATLANATTSSRTTRPCAASSFSSARSPSSAFEPGRLKLVWASAAEGVRLAEEIGIFVEEVRALGPLDWRGPGSARGSRRGRHRARSGRRARTRRDGRSGGRGNSRGGAGVTDNGKPKLAMYWAAGVRRLRDRRPQHRREDPRGRRPLRRRLLAVRDGRQVQGRRGHGRRLDPADPLQRRHPQQRERGAGAPPAPQVADPGGLRLLRQRRLHPRPGEPRQPRGDLRRRLRTAPPPTTRTASGRMPVWQAPEGELHLPDVLPGRCKTLDQVVPVDYYVPGCPPESHQIAAVVDMVIAVARRRGRAAAAGRDHRRRHVDRLRRVPARRGTSRRSRGSPDPGPRRARPDALPARAGRPLQRPGDARRLWCAVPEGRRPVHRLLRRAPTASSTTAPG